MPEITELLHEYGIDRFDLDNIKIAAPKLLARKEELADFHYAALMGKSGTAHFFPNEKIMVKARHAFINWVELLLKAEYNHAYYLTVNRAGTMHVRISLPNSHVNIAMQRVRRYLNDAISEDFADSPETALRIGRSLNKVLDLNLDILTRSYREEEMKISFLSYKVDSMALYLAKRVVSGFNMALVLGLIVIGVMVVGLCLHDFSRLFDAGGLEHGVLGALGSLLILWVIIELLDTQIKHMKGSEFAIKVFVSVALVTELRHVLIISIEGATWIQEAVLAGTVLVLGIIYWLVSRVDHSS